VWVGGWGVVLGGGFWGVLGGGVGGGLAKRTAPEAKAISVYDAASAAQLLEEAKR